MVITQPASVTGIGTVVVTAVDGITIRNYTLNFSVAPSNDATLSTLTASVGTLSPAFNKNVLTYTVTVPYGTTTVPTITAAKSDANASIVITNAATLSGNTTIQVTAADGLTSLTYTISFEVTPPATDATLSSLKVGSLLISGF